VDTSSRALVASLKKYHNILILVKGSPDPDVIASSFAMSALCRALDISCSIVAGKKLSLPENRAMVNILEIPLVISPGLPGIRQFDSYIVTDHPSPSVVEQTAILPCAVFIDHHEPIDEEIRADFVLRNRDAGSTSTLVALLLKDLEIELNSEVMTPVATALVFGIYTDTDKYSHAGRLDYEALDYLSKFSDHNAFNKISNTPLSKETLTLLKRAIGSRIHYKEWLIAGVGYVHAADRDSIAIIADFLLKREKCPTVIVFAAIEDAGRRQLSLDASFRSASEILNLNEIIKKIAPTGGARKFKGAYQIDLDYFHACPDRKLLWEVIQLTTVELLKKSRDEMYITEMRGVYRTFKRKIRDYFS
jgi:nanoRNase/pAp phosphatase (c-di-AMP/oligoRNAs hydrolase)